MNREEMIDQINNLIESWYLKEADLNQKDIDSIKYLLEENKKLSQLNQEIYIDKSEKILDDLEKWLEEEKQLNGDVTMKISEVSIAILEKLKELKGDD